MVRPEESTSIAQLKVRLLGISPMIWRASAGAGMRVAARAARHLAGEHGLGGHSLMRCLSAPRFLVLPARAALKQWQASRGEAPTGYLEGASAKVLLAAGEKRAAQERQEDE